MDEVRDLLNAMLFMTGFKVLRDDYTVVVATVIESRASHWKRCADSFRETGALVAPAQIAIHVRAKELIISAAPRTHAVVRLLFEKIDAPSRNIDVMQLQTLDARGVAAAIGKALANGPTRTEQDLIIGVTFQQPGFRRMLANALFWTTGRQPRRRLPQAAD